MLEKWFKPAAETAEKESPEETPREDSVIQIHAPGVISDPSTGTPLGSAASVEDAKRIIRQASEDQREAA